MRSLTSIVRPAERRETAAAFAVVALVMIAHALLETARDTFFLANLPARQLPWVYLAIAALAVISGPVLGRAGSEHFNRSTLFFMQTAAAVGTAGFVLLIDVPRAATFYALYLWGGIAAAVILVRFWLILGDRFSATQAKRLFPIIASAAVLGSLIGYALAGAVAARHQPRALLIASAAAFLSSVVAALWWRASARAQAAPAEPDGSPADLRQAGDASAPGPWRSLALTVRHAYVRRVAAMLLLASVSATLCDFIFKSVVSRSIPTARLGSFLATVYFACDLASLALLVLAVAPFVRAVGVPQALAVRPALLAVAAALLTVTGGLAAAVVLRAADGTLRWSLHKTATELLYVPMSPRLRGAVKEFSDLLAQRGGQALGSLLILAALSVVSSERWLGPLLIACAGSWAVLALSLRAPYLNLFRESLNEASIEVRLDFPELDVASLETLLAALNSPDDDRVLTALDLLGATGRPHVIPALILYHPSAPVVVRALDLFADANRGDIVPLSQRLLSHADAAVRAAAMRARGRLAAEPDRLLEAGRSSCPIVAATALIAAAAREVQEPREAVRRVERMLRDAAAGGTAAAPFVARALREFPVPAAAPLLAELMRSDDGPTRLEAVRAAGALRDPAHLPALVAALSDRELREAARAALVAYGDPGLGALERALSDVALPRPVRTQVPRSISRFGHQRAADILLRRLLDEPSGMVRYRIMRGLGRMRADTPGIELDAGVVERVVDDHLTKTFQLVHWRAVLDAGVAAQPARDTVVRRLLGDLLGQKEAFAIERLFRALGLACPGADFAQLYEALDNPDAAARASARELLEHVLPARWRAAVLGLTDDGADGERLASGSDWYTPAPVEYDELVTALAGHPSDIVSALASCHAAELDLRGVPERPERPWGAGARELAAPWERSLQELRERGARAAEKLRNAG